MTLKHYFIALRHKLHLTTPFAIILAAIILGSSHVVYALIVSRVAQAPTESPIFMGKEIDASDLATENTESNVIIVEYSDTECPFCAQFQPTIKKIRDEYAAKIGFVYRYFPLTQIHPDAFEEARAIHCVGVAGDAKKRAQYIDDIFAYKTSKQNMVLPNGAKEALAKNLGINQTQFDSCMKNKASSDAIDASLQDGIQAGVEGTPATFVLVKNAGGYEIIAKIDGARPYAYVKAAVEEALSR